MKKSKAAPARDEMDIGKRIGAWALHQTDDYNREFDPPRPGAHDAEVGINGVSVLAKYMVANPDLSDDEDGYEEAYQACMANGSLAATRAAPGPAATPGTGPFTLAAMDDDDWAYIIGTVMTTGRDPAVELPKLFQEDSNTVNQAWNTWNQNNEAFRSNFNRRLYTGKFLGFV